MSKPRLICVSIEYDDGHRVIIDATMLAKLEAAYEVITLLERAKALYEEFKPLFGKK